MPIGAHNWYPIISLSLRWDHMTPNGAGMVHHGFFHIRQWTMIWGWIKTYKILSMFVRYVWAFRTRVLKPRVSERAFWVNPFFQWYKVNSFPGFEQRNLFPPLKKRMWSSGGLKVVYEATRKLIFPTPDPFWVRQKRFWPHQACGAS